MTKQHQKIKCKEILELSNLTDCRDIEDTLIWIIEKFQEREENDLLLMSNELLKKFLIYKNDLIINNLPSNHS